MCHKMYRKMGHKIGRYHTACIRVLQNNRNTNINNKNNKYQQLITRTVIRKWTTAKNNTNNGDINNHYNHTIKHNKRIKQVINSDKIFLKSYTKRKKILVLKAITKYSSNYFSPLVRYVMKIQTLAQNIIFFRLNQSKNY